MRAVETEMEPLISAHYDKIIQNAKLYARVEAVYNSAAKSSLTPEQQRLVWLDWKNFTFRGAKLPPADKAKLADLNQKLADLYTKFRANQLFDEETDLTLDKA